MMDNKEILERNKNAAPADEGQLHQENRARWLGTCGMLLLIVVLLVYNLFKGLPSHGIQSILWAYIGVEALFKYRFSQNRRYFTAAVCGILASLAFLANYIITTW